MTKDKDEHKNHAKKPAKKHASAGPYKVFDIMPPGRSPAAANSRSVPPPLKPPTHDDQMVPGAPRMANDPNDKKPLLTHHEPVALMPGKSPETAADTGTPDTVPEAASTPPPAPAETTPPPEAPPSSDLETDEAASAPTESEAAPAAATPAAEMAPPFDQSDEAKAGQLAVEQVVKTEDATPPPAQSGKSDKSIDDLLAESDAPHLDQQGQEPGMIISHHEPKRHSWGSVILIIIVILLVAVIVLDVLLDAEVITTDLDVPYTNFL